MNIAPLTHISPSTYTAIKACSYRIVLQSAKNPALLPSSPASRLGTVVHRLLQLVGVSHYSVDDLWQYLLAREESEMKRAHLQARFVPLAHHIRNFRVLEIQAKRRAEDLLKHGERIPRAKRSPGLGREVKVSTGDGTVRGRIDLVTGSPSAPTIRDYKTGSIEAEDGNLRTEIVEQLNLYAALYAEKFGVWPTVAEVSPFSSPETRSWVVQPNVARSLLNEARSLLSTVNSKAKLPPESAVPQLARPSVENCRYCLYRPACSAYVNASAPLPFSFGPAITDLLGTLVSISSLQNGFSLAKIKTGSTLFRVRNLQMSVGIERGNVGSLIIGSNVGIFNVRRTSSPTMFEATEYTAAYEIAYKS